MSEDRLIREFLACGFTGFTNLNEGHPVFSPTLSPSDQAIAELINTAHIEDDNQYRGTDLRVDPECLTLYGAVSPAQWDAYRGVQKVYIQYERRLRMRAPVNPLGVTPGDLKDRWLQTNAPEDRTAWLQSLLAIVNALPFPSGQE